MAPESAVSSSTGLPLLDLFTRLREADLPLGIDEYRQLLRALQLGFGTAADEPAAQAALRRLCKVLWVKSREDESLLNYHFDRLVAEWQAARQAQPPPSAEQPASETATPPASHETATLSPTPGAAEIPKPPLPGEPAGTPTAETVQPQDVETMRALHAALRMREMPLKRFVLTGEYVPVTRREMKQNWRYLRRMKREGIPTELDVDQTVKKIADTGFLLDPVLVPPRTNRTELLLLVDQGGSMVPFHALTRQLVDTALRGGRLGRAGVYYFHDVPTRYLYGKPALLEPHAVNQVLTMLHRDRTVALIVSDAGAARGNLDPTRVKQTRAFLDYLKSYVRRAAWLNPMPRPRWDATTAGEIADLLPMFEFTRHGMDQAIDALRGRYNVISAR